MIRGGTLFLALLSVVAQLAVVVLGAAAIARYRRRGGTGPRHALVDDVAASALSLAWLVALVATAGSLFLSEVAGFVPCTLCWYQRLAMYPLVVILGIAAWRGDLAARVYALPLLGLGLALSGYHYLLQLVPGLDAGACDPQAPCTMIWVRHFGYLSIPLMAASAFALIGVLLALAATAETERDGHP